MIPRNLWNDESGVNPILAIILMVVITVILCGVLYTWTTSLSTTTSDEMKSYREDLGPQSVPVEPTGMEISSILDVDYAIFEGDLLCIYTLYYTATFDYESSLGTYTEIPLPQGSVEDIYVRLNGEDVERPSIEGNVIKLTLPSYRENEVTVSYTAFGRDNYNHLIPKNKLVDFIMRLELRGVDYNSEEDLSQKCLAPDTIYNSGDSIVMEWDKTNAILKKDIIIQLPKQSNPMDDYGLFLPALVFLIIIFTLFYITGFKRMGLEMRTEYLMFLGIPIILLYMVLGISLVYFEAVYAVPLALLCFFIISYITQKKMVPVEKGFTEVLMFPYTMVVFAASTIFFWDYSGLVVGTIFLILAIIFLMNFLRKYKPPENKPQDPYKNNYKPKIGHGDVTDEFEKLEQENQMLKAIKKDDIFSKRFCQNCGNKIGPKFEYCPQCGKELKKTKQCTECSLLVPAKTDFCPNCGSKLATDKNVNLVEEHYYFPQVPYYKS